MHIFRSRRDSLLFFKPAQTCSKFVRRLCAIDTTAHKKLQEFIKSSFHKKTIYSEKLNNTISPENIISQLITRRSLVQIQPPQPTLYSHFQVFESGCFFVILRLNTSTVHQRSNLLLSIFQKRRDSLRISECFY